jgi:hypothetical protein
LRFVGRVGCKDQHLLDPLGLPLGIERLRLLEAVRLVPVDEVLRLVWRPSGFAVPIDVCERRDRDAVSLVGDQIAERLQAVERAPLGKLRAVNLFEKLADCLAECER